ncbi:hypothetical protein [Saccharopolyspora spinosa]|uniref:Uncharacterized protein n=1 Tax=Saccharopolyspora spinosa TaxID=60894 RepID=A0A2N3XUU3_SACSN|nr:hypothetical protein [Saccharopolyspora spinosa]PKW14437.1 hypothetical protein A8926_2053 [Saccharopolyspora spinosa]
MAEVLTDERIAAVLRPFVRATAPVLDALRESDPLRLRGRSEELELGESDGALRKVLRQLDGMQLPGSSAWDAMSVEDRCDWWASRVGRFLALVAGLPRFGGVITSRLPIRNALGITGQGLVLCAIAAEHGVTDRAVKVQLIAKVLLERELSAELAAGHAEDDERVSELTEDIEASRHEHGRATPKAVARTVWRMARALWEIDSELGKRPQGRFYHELLGSVPVVGVVGGYLGERSALRKVGRLGAQWLRRNGLRR